jgi:hypothetical protein
MKRASWNQTTICNIPFMDALCVGRPGRSYVTTAGVCMGKESLYRTHVTKCNIRIYRIGSSKESLWLL